MSQPIDFSLEGRVAIITGGAGLLGVRHAEAIASAGGIPVLADIRPGQSSSRLERFPIDQWNADVAVGLTGPFLCARIIGRASGGDSH